MAKTLEESGYKGWPTICSDYRTHPVTVVWWAKTPTGRQSRFLHWAFIHRTRSGNVLKKDAHGHLCNVQVPSQHFGKTAEEILAYAAERFPPPKLKRGYQWKGPFFYTDFDRNSVTPSEGQHGQVIVLKKAPKKSEGIPLSYCFG